MRARVCAVSFEVKTVGRTIIVQWIEIQEEDLARIQDLLKDFGARIGRLPIYIAVTAADVPIPAPKVRTEMLATMNDVSRLTESLHLVLEGKGLRYSATRSVIASMFLAAGNRKTHAHDTVQDALKKTSLDERERADVLAALGY